MSSAVLSRTGILSYLDDEARQQLAGYGCVTPIEPGQVLIREGEVNRRLYIILGGIFCVEHGCALILGINIILSRRLKRANEVIRFHQIVPVFLNVRTRKSATATQRL